MAATQVSAQDEAVRSACRAAVDRFVRSGMTVGIGGGIVGQHVLQRLRERQAQATDAEPFTFACVPSSQEALDLLDAHRIPMAVATRLDVTLDGADEVDAKLAVIKASRGGCHTMEKVLAFHSHKFVVITTADNVVERLGMKTGTATVPVEVIFPAYKCVQADLRTLGAVSVTVRQLDPEQGVGTFMTESQNCVLDAEFAAIDDPATLDSLITVLPGVVSCGLIVGMVHEVLCARADGCIVSMQAKQAGADAEIQPAQ